MFRGGGACGFYKIGGSPGGFNPVTKSEVLPGFELTVNELFGSLVLD